MSTPLLPSWAKPVLISLGLLALLPVGLVAKSRVYTSEEPRYHVIQDMDNQWKFRAQSENPLFADGRAMRPPVPGTVARGELMADDHYERGLGPDGKFTDAFPAQVTVDEALLQRGRERFGIYCAPCHGYSGYGDGPVHEHALEMVAAGRPGMAWVPPTSYHQDTMRKREAGYLFHVATNGVRNMSGYGAQVPTADRWAIVAYIKALQRSQQGE